MVKARPAFGANVSVEEWIRQHIEDHSVAKVMRAYAALTVYDGALDAYSMNAFAEHVNCLYSTSSPLVYAGYDELLEQLKQRILRSGGAIHTGREVRRLVIRDGITAGVETKEQTLFADAVVLNLPASSIAKIADYDPLAMELAPFSHQSPQYVYVYDVMLSRKLRTDITNVLDLDGHVYINDYSLNVPTSAGQGGQLLACLKFLTKQEQQNDDHADRSKQSVEAILDRVYAGWRSHIVGTRAINRAVVNGIARHTGQRLLPFRSNSVDQLYFAGDSTVGRGALGLPAYDSAQAVADLITGRK